MAPRWRSICTTFCLEPLVSVACSALTIGGAVVGFVFIKRSLDSSELLLTALGIAQDDIDMVDEARKANLGTIIGVIGVAGIALVLAVMRTYLSMNMAVRRSSIMRRTSACYLCLLIPSIAITWLATAYLVVVLMALAVWWSFAGLTSAAGSSLEDSDINDKWTLVKQIYGNITTLATAYNTAGRSLPAEVRSVLDPAIASISAALPGRGDTCPKYCFDLSSWNHFDPARSCFCDVTRVTEAGVPAREAARDQLPWAVLGMALACAGLSLLAMDQAAHASRTLADRALAKRGASEFGSPASTPRYTGEAYNGYAPEPHEASAPHTRHDSHTDKGGEAEGLGWAGVSGITGSTPGDHPEQQQQAGPVKGQRSARRRLQDAGAFGGAPDQEAPPVAAHNEIAAVTPAYAPVPYGGGPQYVPQPLVQPQYSPQPQGVRYFPM